MRTNDDGVSFFELESYFSSYGVSSIGDWKVHIGRLCFSENSKDKHNSILYLTSDFCPEIHNGFKAYIYRNGADTLEVRDAIVIDYDLPSYLADSIIKIENGSLLIQELVRKTYKSADLFITGKCTQNCYSCPQDFSHRNDYYPKEQSLLIANLLGCDTKHVNISGGEPTYYPKLFNNTLDACLVNCLNANIQILTNCMYFSDKDRITNNMLLNRHRILFSVALYGIGMESHDIITQTKNSYSYTWKGINNLTEMGFDVEIRFVITKQNFKLMVETISTIISMNSMIRRLVFIGCEYTGQAHMNLNDTYVEYCDYSSHLIDSIKLLSKHNVLSYIYNIPFCCLPETLWSIAKDSISDWKKRFLPQCKSCIIRQDCCGVFSGNVGLVDSQIKPYLLLSR